MEDKWPCYNRTAQHSPWPTRRDIDVYHCSATWASWRQSSSANRLFVNSLFRHTTKETSKLCITGPLWRESTSDRWIPLIKGPWRHHVLGPDFLLHLSGYDLSHRTFLSTVFLFIAGSWYRDQWRKPWWLTIYIYIYIYIIYTYIQVWPKFYPWSCRAMCNIVLYCTAIYREYKVRIHGFIFKLYVIR